MPTYEYECTKCSKRFELFQSIKAKPKRTLATDCDQCGGKAPVVRCIGTGGGLIFKGSGFYITDYRSENYKQSARSESDGGKPDAATSDNAGSAAAPKPESATPERKPGDAPSGDVTASKSKPTGDPANSRKSESRHTSGGERSRKRRI